jgi:HAD superfamily hydrolase (TIGR01490 family)
MSQIAAFFDIDGTIYRNSLLIEHFKKLIKYELVHIKEYEDFIKEAFKKWDERQGDYESYMLSLTEKYKSVIKGLPIKYNEFIADQVVNLKGNRIYTYTREKIFWHQAQGHLVIFISGSPDFLVSRMASKWKIDDYCGSIYHAENDALSGEISPMWDTPNKIKAIEKFKDQYKIDLSQSYAYGDTNGDWGMLQMVGLPTAFNPSKELLLKIKADPILSQKCKVVIERKDVIFHLNSDVLIEH